MRIAVPKETAAGENRVAATPETVKKLVDTGNEVLLQAGAGVAAGHPDSQYTEAGAQVKPDAAATIAGADAVLRVGKPTSEEVAALPDGSILIGYLDPLTDEATAQSLAAKKISAFAMESIPRTTRAQSMDSLSSQATVSGYKAVLIAADEAPKFLPMLTTAAGTVRPAKVFVIGAGVAGLQAIATARRLGAIVHGFDVRPAVKEQVESLGAKFVEIDLGTDDAETSGGYAKELTDEQKAKQTELMSQTVIESDIVITTAAIPGRTAPMLIPTSVVDQMAPGSVIIDLAAETGGNCELTQAGQTILHNGVKVIGPANLPSTMPLHASQLYAKNVSNLLELMIGEEGAKNVDFSDEILDGACLTHDGKLKKDVESFAPPAPAPETETSEAE
ncbi:MAG: Re/Si-specific NAD(P)(+) transhydrogenase subunit alpha [Actinobacteria bacterium]|nr:Re/Si-specific NAD(P)(+) transhydrogenase subunit alpha [Actinomycetota bacterium]